ncbi:MAG: hypothetical protein WBG76_14050 [Ornithinimicrobium sp.]
MPDDPYSPDDAGNAYPQDDAGNPSSLDDAGNAYPQDDAGTHRPPTRHDNGHD